MKIKAALLSIGVITALLAAHSHARKWTSADGAKSFEGDFIKGDASSVTIKKGSRELTFPLDKLSEEDQAHIKELIAKAEKAAAAKAASEKLKDAKIPKALSNKLVKLNESGKKFSRFSLESGIIPQYYVLYYSASW